MANLLTRELELMRISSITLAILEATLSPRNRETYLFPLFPTLFGHAPANDTHLDPPTIRTINDLEWSLLLSQKVLAERQITVLNHRPRQLIPSNIGQLAKSAFAMPEDEGEEL